MNHAFHTFIYNKFYSCLYHDLANTDVINFLQISSVAGYLLTLGNGRVCYLLENPVSSCDMAQA